MSYGSKTRKPMKVVHIQTQYVETDACSFKSVVQNLTGKDSTIAESPSSFSSSSSSSWVMKLKKEIDRDDDDDDDDVVPHHQSRLARMSYANNDKRPSTGQYVLDCRVENNFLQEDYSFLTRNLSYKEMDRLLKELPPLDDLHKILSFD